MPTGDNHHHNHIPTTQPAAHRARMLQFWHNYTSPAAVTKTSQPAPYPYSLRSPLAPIQPGKHPCSVRQSHPNRAPKLAGKRSSRAQNTSQKSAGRKNAVSMITGCPHATNAAEGWSRGGARGHSRGAEGRGGIRGDSYCVFWNEKAGRGNNTLDLFSRLNIWTMHLPIDLCTPQQRSMIMMYRGL